MSGLYEHLAKAGKEGLGANLDAPADPLTEGYPARPEWYFLFLFQLLKYFEGDKILIGTVAIPNGVVVLLCLLPLFGYGTNAQIRPCVRRARGGGAVGGRERFDRVGSGRRFTDTVSSGLRRRHGKGNDLHYKFAKAEKAASRAVQLASQGIPEDGGRYLLRGDPLTQGPKLFEKNCGVCHAYSADATRLHPDAYHTTKAKYKASDLAVMPARNGSAACCKIPHENKYFGLTGLEGMKNWRAKVEKAREKWQKNDGPEAAVKKIKEEEADLDTIASGWQTRPDQKRSRDAKLDSKDKDLFHGYLCVLPFVPGRRGKRHRTLRITARDTGIRGMIMDPASPARAWQKE